MFLLDASVKIGKYKFNVIHELEYIKSVDLLSDTAIVKLPTSFKVRQNGDNKLTENAINIGDEVRITVGYKGKYSKEEYVGYVKKIKPTIPIEIECEDAIWLLRRKRITKAWNSKTTLQEVLNEVVKDTTLKLAENSAKIELDKYIIRNANGAQVLEHLKKELRLTSYLNDKGELYCGLRMLNNIDETVKYDLNYNIIENNLEFKSKQDRKIRVRYIYVAPDNKRTQVEVGDTHGALRTFHTSVVSDKSKLKEMAQSEIDKLKYDGFDGSIKSFLIPYATRGMKAELIDKEKPNRNGNYFIKKVKTMFGVGGARRIVTIGTRL